VRILNSFNNLITCTEGSEDKTIRIWNISNLGDGYEIRMLSGHNGSVRDITIIPDYEDAPLVSCSNDGTIKLWNYADEDGKVLRQFEHHSEFRCITYCSARRELLAGTSNGSIFGYKLNSAREPETVENKE